MNDYDFHEECDLITAEGYMEKTTAVVTVGDLRALIADQPEDMPVVFSFNGCTESGEVLATTEIAINNALSVLGLEDVDESQEAELAKVKVLHLYSNRLRFFPKDCY